MVETSFLSAHPVILFCCRCIESVELHFEQTLCLHLVPLLLNLIQGNSLADISGREVLGGREWVDSAA